MASIRLTQEHRRWLRNLAQQSLKSPAEQAAEDAAYAVASPLVRKLVEDKYPPKDMKLLAKYEAARRDSRIRLNLTAGGVTQFNFRTDEEAPMRPNRNGCSWHIYQADEAATAAVLAHAEAVDARQAAFTRKFDDYRALIFYSRKLEEVEAVWPAASALRATLGRTLPVTLSEEVAARIRADVQQQG